MERFADIQILRYKLKDFTSLSPRQRCLVYCLSEATLWGRDITFDQFGIHNLRIRKLFETIFLMHDGKDNSEDFCHLTVYLKQMWFDSGIHHHYSTKKIQPLFSRDYFRKAAADIPSGQLPLNPDKTREDFLAEMERVIFDEDVMPIRVCQDAATDMVKGSACNYYENVGQNEAMDYYKKMHDRYAEETGVADRQPSWGLNSRLVKKDGRIYEETYMAGGKYSGYISKIIFWLKKAMDFAETDGQRDTIAKLVEYYSTGDLKRFDDYSIAWLAQTANDVDFINGFIEVYGDPLAIKGSWEGIVHYKDHEATHRTQLLSDNAQWFEDNSPVDARFKKQQVKGVTANVVCAAMLGGDEYPHTAIGINLPNADWIRSEYGSKSVTISNITEAYNEVSKESGFIEEFVPDESVRQLIREYGNITDDLHTDLHECIGHGSGQMLPEVSPNALLSYASTIEEARADLFALYYIADPKLVEMKLLNDADAYKAQYYTYMMNGLMTQCVRIPLGETIQESHMRNRAVIANYIYRNGNGCISVGQHDGKTYMTVNDYDALRNEIARLLAEVQRIKSEGDYDAAKHLVEEYGINIDPDMHREMRTRYAKLNIAPYKGFVNPWLKPVCDGQGRLIDVEADCTETYTQQMLRYSRDYSLHTN